jgi:hypothetical protein
MSPYLVSEIVPPPAAVQTISIPRFEIRSRYERAEKTPDLFKPSPKADPVPDVPVVQSLSNSVGSSEHRLGVIRPFNHICRTERRAHLADFAPVVSSVPLSHFFARFWSLYILAQAVLFVEPEIIPTARETMVAIKSLIRII